MRLPRKDRDAVEAIRTAAGGAATPQETAWRVANRIAEHVEADSFCFMLTDPDTGVPLDVVGKDGSRFEKTSVFFGNVWKKSPATDYLARAAEPARVHRLEQILGPQWQRDPYVQSMVHGFGYDREIHVSFAAAARIWGYLSLHRKQGSADFERRADRFLAAVAPVITYALRQQSASQLLATVPAKSEAIITLGPDGTVEALTDFARHLVEARPYEGISFGVSAMAASLRHAMENGEAFAPRALPCVDTVTGQRFQIHGELLRGADGRPRGVVFARALRGFDDARALAHLGLSPREAEVALAAARGFTTKEIAASLALSPHTVESHVKTIFDKLGVSSRGELAAIVFGG